MMRKKKDSFFVALTRSRKELYILKFRSNINPYERVMSQEKSRFMSEVRDYIEML